ncbi:MAG: TetR family transcriptional regulator [Streptosporangiales bacterium]|nr:TetR family transcriptional regulator [Streptosporangiales bacterium]
MRSALSSTLNRPAHDGAGGRELSRTYSMQKRGRAREDTRQRLMSAAADLIMEKGSAKITMTAVAGRADVALRTVYNHFASVDALLASVMSTINEEFAALAPAVVDARPRSPEHALRDLVVQWFHELAKHDQRIGALITIRDSVELAHALASSRQLRLERLRSVLSMAADCDRLRVPLDEAAAMAYVQTGYQSWVALVRQLDLSNDEAADLVTRSIAAFSFRRRPYVPRG